MLQEQNGRITLDFSIYSSISPYVQDSPVS